MVAEDFLKRVSARRFLQVVQPRPPVYTLLAGNVKMVLPVKSSAEDQFLWSSFNCTIPYGTSSM